CVFATAVCITRTNRDAPHLPTAAADSPEACVRRMLAAERRGHLTEYLACFCDLERHKVQAAWEGRSEASIRTELQAGAGGNRGCRPHGGRITGDRSCGARARADLPGSQQPLPAGAQV